LQDLWQGKWFFLFSLKQTATVSLFFGLYIFAKDGRHKVAEAIGEVLFAGIASLVFLLVLKVFSVRLGITAIEAGM
jgi:hypothetical protein